METKCSINSGYTLFVLEINICMLKLSLFSILFLPPSFQTKQDAQGQILMSSWLKLGIIENHQVHSQHRNAISQWSLAYLL